MKRPLASFCKVQALMAVMVGLRGKAMAMAVLILRRAVACAASAMTM